MKTSNLTSSVFVACVAFSLIHGQSATESPSKPSVVTRKASISKKPEPKYTEEAKKLRIEGTVVLRCIFRSSGKVTDITVSKGLPNGLTEQAIEAAKQIKFKPAMKNGHPVSMYMQLEYNFYLY